MAIKGILFDKDGTLIDFHATWLPVYHEVLEAFHPGDRQRHEALMAATGYDWASGRFLAGSVMAGGTTQQLVDIWWPDLPTDETAERKRRLESDFTGTSGKYLKPLMPLQPVLTELLDSGYRLGVATNDSELSARRHMAQLGIAPLFEAIIGWDSVARPKPAGDMITHFAALTGLAPSEIAMVGDNPHDMETARAGGAGLAIAVLSGNAAHAEIAHLADHTLGSIAGIAHLLHRL